MTSINSDGYKYKEYKNKLELYFLKNMSQFVFNHNYISAIFQDALIIQLWLNKPNIQDYCSELSSKSEKVYTTTTSPLVRIIENTRSIENIQINSNENDIIDEIVYKKNITPLYTIFKTISTEKDYIVSCEISKPIEKEKIESEQSFYKKKLEKMKFILPK
jgi:hypothetical protein